MNKQTFILETKTTQDGVRGERIHKVVAESYTEAINLFANIKQMRPDQLLDIYKVYEQPTDGK